MPSLQNDVITTQSIALSDLYARAVAMSRRLGSSRISSGTGVSEVKSFQLAWNQYRGETSAWFAAIELTPSRDGAALLRNGLTADAKYGQKTALALAMLMYAAGLSEDVLAQMPTVSSNFPVWYAANQSLVEGVLLRAVESMDSLPGETTVPTSQSTQDVETVVDEAREAPAEVEQDLSTMTVSNEDMVFESGSTIASAAGRTSWDVPLWAIGLGVVTIGGLVYAIAKRKKKSAEIRA